MKVYLLKIEHNDQPHRIGGLPFNIIFIGDAPVQNILVKVRDYHKIPILAHEWFLTTISIKAVSSS